MSNALTDSDVQPGDIFLCKNYGVVPGYSMNGGHAVIRAGQAVFSHVRGGSSNTVHAAVAVYHNTDGKVVTAEADGNGLVFATQEVEAVVFRNRDPELAKEAGRIADHFTQMAIASRERYDGKLGRYSYTGAMVAVFRRQAFGSKANFKMYKASHMVDKAPDEALMQGMEIDMFCSEFAILCHQLAALKKREISSFAIVRDAQAMSPKALEGYLRGHTDLWEKVGRYNRPSGGSLSRWATRLTRKEPAH